MNKIISFTSFLPLSLFLLSACPDPRHNHNINERTAPYTSPTTTTTSIFSESRRSQDDRWRQQLMLPGRTSEEFGQRPRTFLSSVEQSYEFTLQWMEECLRRRGLSQAQIHSVLGEFRGLTSANQQLWRQRLGEGWTLNDVRMGYRMVPPVFQGVIQLPIPQWLQEVQRRQGLSQEEIQSMHFLLRMQTQEIQLRWQNQLRAGWSFEEVRSGRRTVGTLGHSIPTLQQLPEILRHDPFRVVGQSMLTPPRRQELPRPFPLLQGVRLSMPTPQLQQVTGAGFTRAGTAAPN